MAAPRAAPAAPVATEAPGAVALPAARSFPPADVKPPHPRSAEAEDGRWKPVGDASAGERAAEPPGTLVQTLIHPHPASRFITLTVVAADLTALSLHFLPGAKDVGKTKLEVAPGLVPSAEQARLVAIFNGGFQPRHGRWGMHAAGATVVPPREAGCTVALHRDGAVSVRSWPALRDREAELVAYRQTPPCLLEQGRVHPDLLAGRDKAWGGRTPGLVTRRRSAIGIDASGSVLFYAIGVETSPRLLAEGLAAVGAEHAAELDINWNWTRFLLVGARDGAKLQITSALAKVDFAAREYLERAADRDFFYLLKR